MIIYLFSPKVGPSSILSKHFFSIHSVSTFLDCSVEHLPSIKVKRNLGAPGWLGWLGVWLLISAQVLILGLWIQALCWAQPWLWSLLKKMKNLFLYTSFITLSLINSLFFYFFFRLSFFVCFLAKKNSMSLSYSHSLSNLMIILYIEPSSLTLLGETPWGICPTGPVWTGCFPSL